MIRNIHHLLEFRKEFPLENSSINFPSPKMHSKKEKKHLPNKIQNTFNIKYKERKKKKENTIHNQSGSFFLHCNHLFCFVTHILFCCELVFHHRMFGEKYRTEKGAHWEQIKHIIE